MSVEGLWDRLYRQGDFDFEAPDPLAERFALGLRRSGPGLALDLGCGTGRHARILEDAGLTVVGLDASPVALERFRARAPRAPCVLGDARRLPFADAVFDVVLSVNVLHHARRSGLREALSETARVLRPGGTLFATVASRKDWKYGSGEQLEPHTWAPTTGLEAGIPHHYLDEVELRGLLVGLDVVSLTEHACSRFTPRPGVHLALTATRRSHAGDGADGLLRAPADR